MKIDIRCEDKSVTYSQICYYKSLKIKELIYSVNSKMKIPYNYLLIPVSIYNILLSCENFSIPTSLSKSYVGSIGEIKVHLDIYQHPSKIFIGWDKKLRRDILLNGILENLNIDQEQEIEVIF